MQKTGVNVTKCIIDTVGIPEAYLRKLDRAFHGQGIEFIVEKKADANYKVVSAASICAKVARDTITPNWVFPEEVSGRWSERRIFVYSPPQRSEVLLSLSFSLSVSF